MDHQKTISEVNLMTELIQPTLPKDEMDFKKLQFEYNYYQSVNILNYLLENGLITSEEQAKIEVEIRHKLKPFLYEIYD